MLVSVVAVAEFGVKQSSNAIQANGMEIRSYELPHALQAAKFTAAWKSGTIRRESADQRPIVINDLAILGQAEADGIPFILTEDQNTLARLATQFRFAGLSSVEALLLSDPFDATKLAALLPQEP